MKMLIARNFILVLILCLFATSSIAQELKKEEVKKQADKTLVFKAKKRDLWLNNSKAKSLKNPDDTVEISLSGILYKVPKKVEHTTKDKINRNTPLGTLASVFSANRVGDVKWITENFVEDEKDEIKKIFKDKKVLADSKAEANTIKAEYLTGKADYNGYTILFVKQEYGKDKKITEAIACKETPKGWKMTNALSGDETFDIVFAALATGNVKEK